MEIDLAVFLAAVVENAGGTIILPFDAFASIQQGEPKAITLDLIDDGANFKIGLSEVPNDLV